MTASARSPEALAHDLAVACGLAWAAGAIHLVAAIEHSGEHLSHAVFLALVGTAQLAWGFCLHRSPTRRLLVGGALMSVGVAALWAVSRTGGIPIGPGAGRPEPVGVLDSVASADEVFLALLVGLRVSGGRAAGYVRGFGVFLILLSAVAVTQLGHAH